MGCKLNFDRCLFFFFFNGSFLTCLTVPTGSFLSLFHIHSATLSDMPYGKFSHAVLSCKPGCKIKAIAKQRSHEGRIFSKSSDTFSVLIYLFLWYVVLYMMRFHSWRRISVFLGLRWKSGVLSVFSSHCNFPELFQNTHAHYYRDLYLPSQILQTGRYQYTCTECSFPTANFTERTPT